MFSSSAHLLTINFFFLLVIPLLLSTGKRGNINLLKKTAAEYGDKLPVDGKDGLGNTALHYAAYASHLGLSCYSTVTISGFFF